MIILVILGTLPYIFAILNKSAGIRRMKITLQYLMKNYRELMFLAFILFSLQTAFSQEYDLRPGKKIILRTEAFQSDSDTLDKAMVVTLTKLGEYLKSRPDLKIEITGHSDSTGTPEYNMDLSLRRANRVKDFLVTKYSIAPGNIFAKGLGSTDPVTENTTVEGRAKNRRVEIEPLTSLTYRELTDNNSNPTNEEGVLSFLNGAVQTKAPWDIGFGDAFLSEPIYELHKINTRTESRAEVTFNDNSRLQVGENSLVIVYGLEGKEPAIKEKGNIELVKGNLLAKLKAMENNQKYVVKTPSAKMTYNIDSKSKLAVDKVDRSTVSVFEGNTEVTAAGQSIEVPENFGTQIYKDSPPDPPRQLPDPPTIITPDKGFLPWNKEGVTFTWRPNSLSSKLEVSTDTSFNGIVWSVTTSRTLSKVNLADGVYYYHMQGIDSVGLEGKPTETRMLTVKKYDYERAKLDLLTVDEGINVVGKQDVTISGRAEKKSIVRINSERLPLDDEGAFNKDVHLAQGNNTFIIEARDSVGFENSKTVMLRYDPSRKFGVTLGFSPIVFPNKYGTLKAGASVSLKFPQLFSTTHNFGIGLSAGEYILSDPNAGTNAQLNTKLQIRPYGFAELMLTIEGSNEKAVVPFMEVTSGAFLWPKYRGDYYSTPSGGAYTAGVGLGIRSNGPTNAFGVLGLYRWITSDYKRFDPWAHDGIHGMLDIQLAYYWY